MHETILEISTDSTSDNKLYNTTQQQFDIFNTDQSTNSTMLT